MLNSNPRAIVRAPFTIWPVALLFLLFLLFLLIGHLTASLAVADGMVMPPPDYELYEFGQIAFLEHDPVTQTEHLTIMPHLRGDARNFAWIVPVPSLPEVTTGDQNLFSQLSTMTAPVYRDRGDGWNCGGHRDVVYSGANDGGVEIINAATVGVFRIMILAADEAPALLDSLTTWGFLHDGNADEAGPAIAHYVAKDWFFVTMEVDSTTFNPNYSYYRNAIEPIRFSFAAAEPIYPLRISAVSAYPDSYVYLYTKSNHRLLFPGAETHYANRITASELSEIKSYYPAVGATLKEGDFLTKLVRRYSPVQMTEDLVLVRYPTDEELLPLRFNYGAFPLSSVLVPGTGVAWFVWRRKRKR